jgi:tricorn protease
MRIIAAVLIFCAALLPAVEARLVYSPDITADEVVFTFEDDLWTASLAGGEARRVTSHPGSETAAKFSPDGKWLAFTASYDGGQDVYVMPSGGGEAVRLTWHPAGDTVRGWSDDGKWVYFVSNRALDARLYRVPAAGGAEEELPIPKVRHASVGAGGSPIAYVPTSADRQNWRGYKGGQQQDIWLFDAAAKTYAKIIAWEGYDNFPMLTADAIYFSSDREFGRMNLFRYDRKTKTVTRLTEFKDWDVESPSYGASRIAYVCGGWLWICDTRTGANAKLAVSVPSERWQARDFAIDPAEFVQDVSPLPDGKRAVVEARGDLYLIDTELEKAENLTRSSDTRETAPAVSPDGKTVAFYSDRSGEYELYTMEPRAGAPWTQVTKGSKTYYYRIAWSPDGSKLAFQDKDFTLFVAEPAQGTVEKADRFLYLKDNEIFWEWADYSWSPDGRWLAYSVVVENMNSALRLYDTKEKKVHALSDGYFDDFSPAFDDGGRLLYFLSNRHFKPQLDFMMDNNVAVETTEVLAYLLQERGPVPFTKEFIATLPKEKAKAVEIAFDGLADRVFRVPVKPGTYKGLRGRLNGIAYLSRPTAGFPGMEEFFNPKGAALWDLNLYALDGEGPEEVCTTLGSYAPTPDGKKAAYFSGKEAGLVDLKGGAKKEKLFFYGLKQTVQTGREHAQILRDVWRQVRDFFYDPGMHGVDWDGVYAKYAPLVPYVANRADLNTLMGDVIGELCVSHAYIIGRGGPKRLKYDNGVETGLLGADLEADAKAGHWRIARILKGRPGTDDGFSPLLAPGVGVKAGEYLLAVDGVPLKASDNLFRPFAGKAEREVTLTVNAKPEAKGAREVRVKTISYEGGLRYQDWVRRNAEAVEGAAGGRVGYMHLADMDEEGLGQFEEAFRALRYRDGLIIDVRGNGGGFVSWFILDKLDRRLKFLTQTRDQKPMRYPHGVHPGPVVVLCDEETGSDGEVFTEHFKELGRGTVLGTRTWGGLVGIINMVPLLDGGSTTQPNVGFANLRGEWVVENHGAEPDIVVEQDPVRVMAGQDPQLEAGIARILEELKKNPVPPLAPPPFPSPRK